MCFHITGGGVYRVHPGKLLAEGHLKKAQKKEKETTSEPDLNVFWVPKMRIFQDVFYGKPNMTLENQPWMKIILSSKQILVNFAIYKAMLLDPLESPPGSFRRLPASLSQVTSVEGLGGGPSPENPDVQMSHEKDPPSLRNIMRYGTGSLIEILIMDN